MLDQENFAKPLIIGSRSFLPGERGIVQLPFGHLLSHTEVCLDIHVIRGKKPGPRVFIFGAIHGDEINGVQISRKVLTSSKLKRLRGDLIVIPVANPPAFSNRARYLPDRRDLNRLFPGSDKGSLGARLARQLTSIMSLCTHGIDLHTGAVNRPNLPQVRISPGCEESLAMARAFDAPVIVVSKIREDTLRAEMAKRGAPVLLYEAGEAEVLDPTSVRIGYRGLLKVLTHLEMFPATRTNWVSKKTPTVVSKQSGWVRSPKGGLFLPSVRMGRAVAENAIIGTVEDPYSSLSTDIISDKEGVIIGMNQQAVVDEGDGLFHIANTRDPEAAEEKIGLNQEHHDNSFDELSF
ncbi:MAG: succinylglutamate desuccinylase/aspartoacylase family protein [Verrucomicrobiota bacterium]